MARSFLTAINLNKNELQNAAVQNLGAAPSSPVKGQLYFNSTGGDNTLYWWDGTTWVPAKASGGAFPGYGPVVGEITFGIVGNSGVATTVARSDHTHGNPTHLDGDHTFVHLNALAAPNATVNMGNQLVSNVAAPVSASDATNKNYVDNLVAGLSWKDSVRFATTPADSGFGLTGLTPIDGVTPVAGDRVLVKDMAAPANNGIWIAASGGWSRATDGNPVTELLGAAVFVEEGTLNGDTGWVCTSNANLITSENQWAKFAGGGSVVAGAGLTQSGNTLNVVAANGSVTVGADDIQVAYLGPGGAYGTALTAARSDHYHQYYVKSFTYNNTTGTSTVVPHNLGTKNVSVTVWNQNSPYEDVEADVERTDFNNVTVRFSTSQPANTLMILVMGVIL